MQILSPCGAVLSQPPVSQTHFTELPSVHRYLFSANQRSSAITAWLVRFGALSFIINFWRPLGRLVQQGVAEQREGGPSTAEVIDVDCRAGAVAYCSFRHRALASFVGLIRVSSCDGRDPLIAVDHNMLKCVVSHLIQLNLNILLEKHTWCWYYRISTI